jgi:GDPmannose 4,6-dehydratase|tara:strand:+ start:204 stop:1280 length:1077 start_codon:yes stop_codon:yes gene_type:complete
MKVAVISGVTGQDGSYLSELLLSKGYFVIGFSRRVSVDTSERIKHLLTNANFQFEEGDICDPLYIAELLTKYRVEEFYNLAAQSHVHTSFSQPVVTTQIDYIGPLNILNCIKSLSPQTRFYQASTSEMFGDEYDVYEGIEITVGTENINCPIKYQDEQTPFSPQSPYAIAKLAAHHACRLYRESYGLFTCCGILFNHESPRRGEKFVTRKITKWIGEFVRWVDGKENIITGDQDSIQSLDPIDTFPKLRLGNLDAHRDWGHAKDYVLAMWMMMQHDKPDDYVVATGESHTIREFLDEAFYAMNYEGDWEDLVVIDPKFYRPAEVDYLNGVYDKIETALDWKPEYAFEDLVAEMVEEDL